MDNVPPGMGPIEYRALCRSQVDPALLKAVRDRTWEKFSKYPGAVNGPPRVEWQPPPPSSDDGDSVTGLLSPGASDHEEPAHPPERVEGGSKKEDASMSHDRKRASRSPVTPTKSEKTCSRKDSRMSKTERRKRKVETRNSRSKSSSPTSFSELDETNKSSGGPGSPAAVAQSSGKDSPLLEHSPRSPVHQSSTKSSPSKPVARIKRKRDDDDDPNRKRVRIEPSTSIPSVASGSAKDTNKKSHTTNTAPFRLDNWFREQEAVFDKPTQSKERQMILEASSFAVQQNAEAREHLLPDPDPRQIPDSATPSQPMGRKIDESALHMLITHDRPSRKARSPSPTNSDQGGKLSRK